MGWTCYTIYGTPKAECDRISTWDNGKTSCRVIKSCMKGNIYYAVIHYEDKETKLNINTAAVFITSYSPKAKGYNFGYKDMEESCDPYYYDFPEKYLNLLSPTDNKFALQWRDKVRQRIEKNKKLTSVKIGDSIKFKSIYNMQSGISVGDEVVLKREARYFTHGYYRWNKKYIPDDFEIIKYNKN